jgi:hypothetical protein
MGPMNGHGEGAAMSRRRRIVLAAVVLLAAALYGWLDVSQRARIDRGPKYHRTDFTVYQAAAEALAAGTDPYAAQNPRGHRYVYPPLLAVLLLPVAGMPPPRAALLFFGVSAAALALALRSLGRPALAGALLCAPFLHESFERGQVTILLLAVQAGAFAAAVAQRQFTAGLLLAAGTALRLTPALPAAALGLGLCAARRGWQRFACGSAAGLLLGFAVIPAAALGPTRAAEVLVRWTQRSGELFAAEPGGFADLDAVDEYRFKNQAVRRVLATWTGWALGAEFDREQPALPARGAFAVDLAAYAVAGACGLLALGIGWRRLRRPDPGAFALVVLLPVFVTRYAWPTHYAMALPAVAFAPPRARLWFALGTAAFYVAHLPHLGWLGAAGPLLLGGALLALALARRGSSAPQTAGSGCSPRA